MKKRLRKKLRYGEFREFGFALEFRLPPDWDASALDSFIDRFLMEAIEAHELAFLGGGRHEWSGFVMPLGRGSVRDDQRTAVLAWLRACPDVHAVRAGQLVDLWHSSEAALELPAV